MVPDHRVVCRVCGISLNSEFHPNKQHREYCSVKCRRVNELRKYKAVRGESLELPSATIGAMHELIIAADLMKMGYHVYRSLSPSCPADLAVLKDGKLLLVEVTTGYYSATNKLSYPPHKNNVHDIIAVVIRDKPNVYLNRHGVKIPLEFSSQPRQQDTAP
jgi:hypothetical protein